MAKKKPKLTPNQLEYQKQLKLLRRRIKSWERRGFLYDEALPETPKRIRKQDIQRLKDIQFKRFTPEQKQQYRRNYEIRDELNRLPVDDISDDGYVHTGSPVQTEAEMDEWLEETFDAIVSPSLVEREREGAKDVLRGLLEDAKRELGVKGMYEYFQEPTVVDQLNGAAEKYINSYKRKNGTDSGDAPLSEFARVLNLGRPLTQDQNEELTMYGAVDFDYGGTDYD